MDPSRELERMSLQLAELIDEITFAEGARTTAERELGDLRAKAVLLETCLQNFLAYTTSLETSVIQPALRDLTLAIPDDTLSQRAQAMSRLDSLKSLTPRTAKIIMSLKNPSSTIVQRFQQRRETILRTHHQDAEPSVNLEEAYLLIAFLLEAKEELRILVDDTIERVTSANRHDSSALSPARASASSANVLQLEVTRLTDDKRKAEEEVRRLTNLMTAVQQDRDVLMAKLQQVAPFKDLQEQYHRERDQLHARLRSVEMEARRQAEELSSTTQALDATRKALEQAYREKTLVEDEVAQSRRQGAAQQSATNTGVHPSRFWEDQAHRLQFELDSLTTQHTSQVTKLDAQISQLRMELAEARAQSGTTADSQREQMAILRRANDEMHRELALLQQQFLSSPSSGSRSHASSSGHLVSSSPPPGFDVKIRAFEDTIRSLHAELAAVEGKVAAVEAHHADERHRLLAQFEEERQRSQREREECDVLVLRMSAEMEQLVKENDTLRSLVHA